VLESRGTAQAQFGKEAVDVLYAVIGGTFGKGEAAADGAEVRERVGVACLCSGGLALWR